MKLAGFILGSRITVWKELNDNPVIENIQVRLNGSCSRTQIQIVELTLIDKTMATVLTDNGPVYCHELTPDSVRTDDGHILVRSALDGIYRRQ